MASLTLQTLKLLLETVTPNVFYAKLISPTETNLTEYIIMQVIDQPNKLNADNASLWKVDNYQVSLYTQLKNETIEQALENALKSADIIYNVSVEDYDTDSSMHRRIYEFELDRFQ